MHCAGAQGGAGAGLYDGVVCSGAAFLGGMM